jgi:hypothetical protein
MVTSLKGLGAEKDYAGESPQHIQKTDPSSRQAEPFTLTNPQLSDSNKNMVVILRWVLDTKTDWPTDRRS